LDISNEVSRRYLSIVGVHQPGIDPEVVLQADDDYRSGRTYQKRDDRDDYEQLDKAEPAIPGPEIDVMSDDIVRGSAPPFCTTNSVVDACRLLTSHREIPLNAHSPNRRNCMGIDT
jgi:hypothetical protein